MYGFSPAFYYPGFFAQPTLWGVAQLYHLRPRPFAPGGPWMR